MHRALYLYTPLGMLIFIHKKVQDTRESPSTCNTHMIRISFYGSFPRRCQSKFIYLFSVLSFSFDLFIVGSRKQGFTLYNSSLIKSFDEKV